MKIYTKTGDSGTTGLFGGGRVSKDALRVEAYGNVDELNASIGAALASGISGDLRELLNQIQIDLFVLGAELASNPDHARPKGAGIDQISTDAIGQLEVAIDRLEEELPPLKSFILPGGTPGGAGLHLARVVCRRAERKVVALARTEATRAEVVQYLNRLSDFLFVVARVVNHRAGAPETPWLPKKV
jgi:cob(I)alamin adenosyltransferase